MAITIQQEPTTPNQANADLIYLLSSTNSNQPQFQFVMEVSDGSDTYTFKQQPNPNDRVVFDMGQVASDFLRDYLPAKLPKLGVSSDAKTINTVFYEEYGTSPSSSVARYNGVSGSGVYVLNGVVERSTDDWNWDSGSYYIPTATPTGGSGNFSYQHALSNSPLTQSIRDDEYQTLSIINGNFDGSTANAQDIYYIQVNVYNEAGSNIQNFGWFNTTADSGGPRTSESQLWSDVSSFITPGTKHLHVAVGPKNFDDAGNTLNSDWYSYKVTLVSQEGAGIEDSSAIYAQKWFTKSEGECGYTGTRFAFLNELGGYDYYSFDLADTKQDNITRETYEQTFVNYTSGGSSIPFNNSRRGDKVYSISYAETRTAQSNYLTQEEADWLRELIESPSVFIQEGTKLLPVVITNSQFTYKTNPRSQKLYTVSVEYKMSNQRRSR
jgi:hypothetical protein